MQIPRSPFAWLGSNSSGNSCFSRALCSTLNGLLFGAAAGDCGLLLVALIMTASNNVLEAHLWEMLPTLWYFWSLNISRFSFVSLSLWHGNRFQISAISLSMCTILFDGSHITFMFLKAHTHNIYLCVCMCVHEYIHVYEWNLIEWLKRYGPVSRTNNGCLPKEVPRIQ